MGDRLSSAKAVQYAEHVLRRLAQAAVAETSSVLGLLSIFESLHEATQISVPHRDSIRQTAEEILARRLEDGCNSDELLQACELLKYQNSEDSTIEQSLTDGARAYRDYVFENELSGCDGMEDCENLIATLSQLSEELGVDMDSALAQAYDAMHELVIRSPYERDYEPSGWSSPRESGRDDDTTVRLLFSSLNLDRDP